MNRHALPARNTSMSQNTRLLQRKCACGTRTQGGGECTACARKRLQRKPLSIAAIDDPLEAEADRAADAVMAQAAAPLHSTAASPLSRAALSPLVPGAAAPPIVDRVLASSGRALDDDARSFMEPRFGRDFSHVRVHDDALAQASARAVDAAAYTVGTHVVLGAGQPALHSSAGRRLLAHELSHVMQQHGAASLRPRISDPQEPAERQADSLAQQALSGVVPGASLPRAASSAGLFRVPLPQPDFPSARSGAGTPSSSSPSSPPRTQPRIPIPPRGPNPAECMATLCTAASNRPASSDADATRRVNDWETGALACIRNGAAGSNASHAAEIQANEESEIPDIAAGLRTALGSLGRSGGRYRDFRNMIDEDCSRKTQEVRLEFHYNVVFENPAGSSPSWGYGSGDWASIEQALSALPAEATWANPQLVRFSRAACHPDDLDAQGNCAGHSGAGGPSRTGGETNPSTGAITIFDAGLDSRPYSRSNSLGLPATQQTLRHEVGHIIDSQIPSAERERFFTDILPWVDYPWAWPNSPATRPPNWTAERDRLKTERGLDDAQLDAWLATLQVNVPVTIGDRAYTRTQYFLSSIDATQLPSGREFEYARSSRSEYLAELYALAVSRPDFLHDKLTDAQIRWLKRVVFRTPQSGAEWAAQLAVRNVPPQLLARLARVFTWEQAQPIIDQIMSSQTQGGGTRDA